MPAPFVGGGSDTGIQVPDDIVNERSASHEEGIATEPIRATK